jgi:hypothetical protein
MPQLQKAIPVAVAPFKKFLRVVIGSLARWYKQRSLWPVDYVAGLFLFSSSDTLPSRNPEGNHS